MSSSDELRPTSRMRPVAIRTGRADQARSRRVRDTVAPVLKAEPEPKPRRARLAWPVVLLCWSLVLPWIIPLGSLSIQPYRLELLVTIFPAFFRVVSGKGGRIGVPEISILLFAGWISLALFIAHGVGAVEQAGSQVIEAFGTFLVARAYIRSAEDFEALARLLFIIVGVVLFPLAVLEAATGRNVVLELASTIMPTHIINHQPPRLGVRRVQSVFEHPILFGVFTSGVFALTFVVRGHGRSALQRMTSATVIALTVFLSLSSGPISTLMVQVMLLVWDKVLRNFRQRWWLLIVGVGSIVLLVDIVSSRPLPAILFSYFALDEASAYFRLLIWEFGSQSVLNHPVFGVGVGEWDRPAWMPASVDIFWLNNAIIGGIPAGLFMVVAFFSSTFSVAFAKGLGAREERCRLAYLVCMCGFFLAGWMVHFWGATYVLFIFLLGSGRWMADSPKISGQTRRHVVSNQLR